MPRPCHVCTCCLDIPRDRALAWQTHLVAQKQSKVFVWPCLMLSLSLHTCTQAVQLLGIKSWTAQQCQQCSIPKHSWHCSHTAGCAVLSFDPYRLPAIQPVPLLLATPADLDSPLDSAISELGPTYDTGFKGAAYLMVHAGQLWSIQYK